MRWLTNLALVVVATALPFAVIEVVLRMNAGAADTPELFRKLPSQVEWSGRPLAHGTHAGVPVAFNEFGLRDRKRSLRPAPGTTRILFLGDSMTFGFGVPLEDAFPSKTEALLNAAPHMSRAPVEVLNFGMPGYNTLHQLAQLRELGLAFQPDIVVVGFLYNDVDFTGAQRGDAASTPSELSPARRLRSALNAGMVYLKHNSRFVAWLTPRLGMALRPLGVSGIGHIGEFKDQFVDTNPNWRRIRAALLEMKALGAEHDFDLAVLIIPTMAKFDEASYPLLEYHRAVAAFCAASEIPHFDLLPAFWGRDGTQMWISPTDGHPDAQAHHIMAEALAGFLAPMVQRQAAF